VTGTSGFVTDVTRRWVCNGLPMDMRRSLPRPLRQALRRGRAARNRIVGDVLMEIPTLAAKSYPIEPDEASYMLPRSPAVRVANDGLPVPPPELREGYGRDTDQYLELGREHVEAMGRVLRAAGAPIEEADAILDFGSSAGAMLRWLEPRPGRSLWGVDVNAATINWAQDHLSPPLLFATTTSLPHLPFEDGTFDLVYSGSVFSHIADLADAWVLELRRVLRPGGSAYLTVLDKHSIEILLREDSRRPLSATLEDYERQHDIDLRAADFSVLVMARAPRTSVVFYDIDSLVNRWGQYLEVTSVAEEAYGYQAALVLRKRQPA
jgi:SAM-dependent methyltransferase